MTSIFSILLLFPQAPDIDTAPPPVPTEKSAPAKADSSPSKAPGDREPGANQAAVNERSAAEPPPAEPDESEEPAGKTFGGRLGEIFDSGAFGLLRRGGLFMWPILIMGIVACGVIIERYRSLKMLTTDSGALRARVRDHLRNDELEEALELCDREQGPVPAILGAGVRKFFVLRRLNYDPARVQEQVVKAMDDYSVHMVAALEKHLPVLATVASAAPMLGFLGTVAGMITSFDEIVAKMGETNIVMAAAGGISVALLTTAFGLLVSIPTFMAFNYFSSVINRFVLEVEESASELIETVTLHLALEQREDNREAATVSSAEHGDR